MPNVGGDAGFEMSEDADRMASSGMREEDIARELGTDVRTVRVVLFPAKAKRADRTRSSGPPLELPVEQYPLDEQIETLEALVNNPLFTVGVHRYPHRAGEADALIEVTDVLAHLFSDLVDEGVSVARDFPGVSNASREDREIIAVFGEDVDCGALAAALSTFWQQRCRSLLARLRSES